MTEHWEPEGVRFYDGTTMRDMLLVADGQNYAGWLCYRHPDGQWVTYRKATDDDRVAIARMVPAVAERTR